MRIAKWLFDCLVVFTLLLVLPIGYRHQSIFLPSNVSAAVALETISSATSSIEGTLGSLSGMLIAVAILASQLSGHKPYSRLVTSFHGLDDWYPFILLLLSLIAAIATLAAIQLVIAHKLYWLLDVDVALFLAAIFSTPSLLLKNFRVFSPKLVADTSLRSFTASGVRKYGLLEVSANRDQSSITFKLKKWGHRHNLVDPLGSFHDILLEAIQERQRITMHLYLSELIRKVVHLVGVPFERRFALASGTPVHRMDALAQKLSRLSRRIFRNDRVSSLQVTVHALHYLVRRANHLIQEWPLDNHRQIFTINLCDMVLCLSNREDAGFLIDVCLDAIVRINLDYRSIQVHGSFEPVPEIFFVAQRLGELNFDRAANKCIRALAYLDLNTEYVTRSSIATWNEIERQLKPEIVQYFEFQKLELSGLTAAEAFPESLWN